MHEPSDCFNHPDGTHDDQFWTLALAVYATKQASQLEHPSMASVV